MSELRPLHNLARIRVNLGLSQSELATRAGFVQQYLSTLERGMRPSDWSHVQRLAAVLGVDPQVLSADRVTITTSVSGQVAIASVVD